MNHEIYLRCHTRVLNGESSERRGTRKSPSLPKYALVFDTETTTDARQALNFASYQFCEADAHGDYVCLEEGLFYADDLDSAQLGVLRDYVHRENKTRAQKRDRKLKL